MPTPSHGGRRPGAGRPRAYTEPMVRKTILLPASYRPLLEHAGEGNLSEGAPQGAAASSSNRPVPRAATPGSLWAAPAPPQPNPGHDDPPQQGTARPNSGPVSPGDAALPASLARHGMMQIVAALGPLLNAGVGPLLNAEHSGADVVNGPPDDLGDASGFQVEARMYLRQATDVASSHPDGGVEHGVLGGDIDPAGADEVVVGETADVGRDAGGGAHAVADERRHDAHLFAQALAQG